MPDGGVIRIRAMNRHIDDPRPTDLQTLSPGPYVNLTMQDRTCSQGVEGSGL